MKLANKLLNLFYQSAILLLLFVFQNCALIGIGQEDRGEVIGVVGRSGWTMTAPLDMVLVPGGSFMMGEVDQDLVGKVTADRRKSVSSFFMDEAEVTNNRYRQFIEHLLTHAAESVTAQSEEDNDVEELSEEETGDQAPTDEENSKEELSRVERLTKNLDESFIRTHLYPDSNVWRNEFTHHMADTQVEYYYEHPGFDDYPVVGITWEAARYFANWRTQYLNDYREKKGLPPYPSFSLPSAAQWEYAARGGKELAKYPWGGPYVRDEKGALRANFKSGEGNFNEGGYSYTSPVRAFEANDYGLYDMAGNVSEWTLDAFNPAAISRTWDLDPVYLDDEQPMKVVKGGSWKDISRFLQTGVSDYEHKDSARSYIGFRCVIPYIGAE
jgi:gliding motility-associated lipoprotein GldK